MQPPAGDLPGRRGVGPCRLIAERGRVQASIQHIPGAGPAAGYFACQRHRRTAGSGQPTARQAVLAQPGRHALQHRVVGIDPAAAGNPHQLTGQLHYGVVVLAGGSQRVDDGSFHLCHAALSPG